MSSEHADDVVEAKSLTKVEHNEDHFSSRWAYWLAAIGCSVGFGNVWRFPYLIFDYGGAAFFIPYLLSLIVVVAPLCVLELGLGQISQHGITGAFNSLGYRARGAGMCFLTCFNLLNFYPLLLCWSSVYFINSFKKNLPWVVTDADEQFCDAANNETNCLLNDACVWDGIECKATIVQKAQAFYERGCNINTDPQGSITRYSWEILLGELFVWVCAFGAVMRGAKLLGYISYVTMTLPIIFLTILVIIGATLPGAGEGIKQYIAKFDGNTLSGDVWSIALSQAIFSIGAVQGSMCGFAAHNQRRQNFFADCWVIICGDTLFAFLAGFAVFAVVGHLAYDRGVPISELPVSGSSLVFQTYPVGLSTVGSPGSQILCVLFFLTLWLLGFTSVVALLEAQILPLSQSAWFKARGWTRIHFTGAFCTYFFLIGNLYCTDMGNQILDCYDYFSANVATIFIALAFSVGGGWVYGSERQIEKCGKFAYFLHACTWIGGSFISAFLGFGLPSDKGRIIGPIVGLAVMGGGCLAVLFAKNTDEEGNKVPFHTKMYTLALENVEDLRLGMNDIACQGSWYWRIPFVWSILLRYIIPLVAMLMWAIGFFAEDALFKRPDAGRPYAPWVFFLGATMPFIVVFVVIMGFILPFWMEFLLPLPEDRYKMDFTVIHTDKIDSEIGLTQKLKDESGGITGSDSDV